MLAELHDIGSLVDVVSRVNRGEGPKTHSGSLVIDGDRQLIAASRRKLREVSCTPSFLVNGSKSPGNPRAGQRLRSVETVLVGGRPVGSSPSIGVMLPDRPCWEGSVGLWDARRLPERRTPRRVRRSVRPAALRHVRAIRTFRREKGNSRDRNSERRAVGGADECVE